MPPPTLSASPFGMPAGYNPYGDALPSYRTGMPNWGSLPNVSPSMGSGGSGMGGDGFSYSDMIMPGLGAVGSGLASLFGMANQNKQNQLNRQNQLNMQGNQINAQQGANTQQLASTESRLDPFRSRMSQMGDVAKLDRVANATTSPVRLNLSGPFAGFKPNVTGGYSYTKSPALVQAAKDAQSSIMSGQADPSMTNPANYGKTGALNLNATGSGQVSPTSSAAFASGPAAPASTLGSDASANMIRQAYMQYLGRQPSDAEIQTTLGNLSQINGKPVTAADQDLVTRWASQNLSKGEQPPGLTPSYAGAGGSGNGG